MSCARCQVRPVVATPTQAVRYVALSVPPSEDPPFPRQRVYATHGPLLSPPEGFGEPRICMHCGVVYYPRTEPHGPRPASAKAPKRG